MDERKLRIAIPAPETDVLNYIAAMLALGAEPVLVDAACSAEQYDGLLLPGGVDVDPSYYHRENVACGTLKPELDAWQFAVLDKFVKLGKPVFGICRGHQVINVYFGGTLIQHVPNAHLHARDAGVPKDKVHISHADYGSYLAKIYGTDFYTNSAHHQASEIIGQGLHVVQHSAEGIVEAAYHEILPVWSVQWHPERMCFAHQRSDTVDGSLVLKFFLDRVKEYCN